ncbi:MAG: NAD(P)H-binding protein [Pseudomonadales bacterium]|nr:NAD(P)H-binding protein [Pseudomonadales bacterium]
MKIAVTGANSSVGQNLLEQLKSNPETQVVAGVRNEKAFASLPQAESIIPQKIAYDDALSLQAAMTDADCVIHLAGILIETKHSNYASANVAATAAVIEAAQKCGVKHLIFISVVGASSESKNAYFRSKGSAEKLISDSGIAASILRTPILLGPGAAGANAIVGMASSGQAKVLGGGHYCMRPLDIDDLSRAIIKLIENPPSSVVTHELVGPESAPYRDIISRTAELMGKTVEVGKVPVLLAKVGAAITSTIKGGGITPTVIDVIIQDEVVETNADAAIGITLTSLEDTLKKIISAGN